ncbi:Lethal factor [Trichophyton interdigitale]|nr:Lethal factor [Trichophyton interdigitale]KAG5217440.1 Lethal factor [Trichophyton interdigitale]KAG8205947.1 Lethal factor [Trichophyton interdigitale]
MTPPAVAEAAGQNDELKILARGFVALLEIARKLTRQEQALQSRLQYAFDEYQKLASTLPEGSDNKLDTIIGSTRHPPSLDETATDNVEWVTSMEKTGYISSTETKNITESLEISTAALRKLENTQDSSTLRTCPFDHGKRRTSMEHDFTTNGIKGALGCPFKKPNSSADAEETNINGESCQNDDGDPIKLEKIGEGAPSTVHSSSARCPIRYLGDHSPEELAEYFLNHKHEIPRSHSVCIRRYQNNPQTSRKIDAKYGNVINMVKGLGEYHQPYLSAPHEIDETGQGDTGPVAQPSSVERVEKWAEDVSNKSPPAGSTSPEEIETAAPVPDEHQGLTNGDDDRQGHFERPLRDVRVGESPSRPWGIHVPPEQPAVDHTFTHPPESHYEKPEGVDEDPTVLLPSQGRLSPLGQASTFGNDAEAEAEANATLDAAVDEDEQPRPEIDEASSHHIHSHHHMPHTNTQTNTYSVPRSNLSPEAPITHIPNPHPRMVFNGPVFFGYTAEAAAMLLEKMGSK